MGKQPTKQLEQDKQKLNQTQSNVSWTKKNVKDKIRTPFKKPGHHSRSTKPTDQWRCLPVVAEKHFLGLP